MKERPTLCVLGDGAWGTAIAALLADNGHEVRLWCHDPVAYQEIKSERINRRYLPDYELPASILPIQALNEAMQGADYIFVAVPIAFLRDVFTKALPLLSPQQTVVILSKGIEQNTLLLPSQIIDELTANKLRIAVVSGPSFARDVVNKVPTGVAFATRDNDEGNDIAVLLASAYFSLFPTRDMTGVQLGGALKNVLALGAGLLDGAGYGTNAQALFFTQAFRELVDLACAYGAQEQTLYGLAGIGDAVLTGMSNQSKNRTLGYRLGQGESLAVMHAQYRALPEGINTLQSLYQLVQQRTALRLPIFTSLHRVVFGEALVTEILAHCLMQ